MGESTRRLTLSLSGRVEVSDLRQCCRTRQDTEEQHKTGQLSVPGYAHMAQGVTKSWATIRKRSGVDVQMYTLRHYYRSRLEQLRVPLVTSMKLLGHQTYDMSQRYTHISDEDARNIAKALENPNVQDLGEV